MIILLCHLSQWTWNSCIFFAQYIYIHCVLKTKSLFSHGRLGVEGYAVEGGTMWCRALGISTARHSSSSTSTGSSVRHWGQKQERNHEFRGPSSRAIKRFFCSWVKGRWTAITGRHQRVQVHVPRYHIYIYNFLFVVQLVHMFIQKYLTYCWNTQNVSIYISTLDFLEHFSS